MANRDNSAIVRKAWLTRKRNSIGKKRAAASAEQLTRTPPGQAIGRKATDADGNPIPELGVKERAAAKKRDAARRAALKKKRNKRYKTLAEFQASGAKSKNFGGRVGGEVNLKLKGGHPTVYKRKR